MGYTVRGSISGRGKSFSLDFMLLLQAQISVFLFFKMSRPALGSIQPPIHWPLVVTCPRVKLPTHFPITAETKDEWSYTSIPPACLHTVHRDNSVNLYIIISSPKVHPYSFSIEQKCKFIFEYSVLCA